MGWVLSFLSPPRFIFLISSAGWVSRLPKYFPGLMSKIVSGVESKAILLMIQGCRAPKDNSVSSLIRLRDLRSHRQTGRKVLEKITALQ